MTLNRNLDSISCCLHLEKFRRKQSFDDVNISLSSMILPGVVNRGDSFRRRRSRSNSLAPSNQQQDSSTSEVGPAVKNRPNGTPSTAAKDECSTNLSSADSARKPANFQLGSPQQHAAVRAYKVAIIGAHGVGKSALVGQFMTSDCINAYDRVRSGNSF